MFSQPGTAICSISRCRSSAATLVKVTGRMPFGSAPSSNNLATCLFSANDLPVPGPATTRLKRARDEAIPYAGEFGSRSWSHGIQNTSGRALRGQTVLSLELARPESQRSKLVVTLPLTSRAGHGDQAQPLN